MKKVYILICAILMVLLIGCNNITVSTGGTNKLDKIKSGWQLIPKKYNTDDAAKALDEIKSELQLIPQKYNTDDAAAGDCFVILNEKVTSKIEIIDKFISDCQSQTPTSLTIVCYSTKYGTNPIITKILYNGFKYYAIEDDTRITNSNSDYHEFEFKYLKVFEENNHKTYVLVNDKKINYSQYIKSLLSSNSKYAIDHQILCDYDN